MQAREPVLELILLAAGAARRFGSAKLMARYEGGTLLAASLGAALAAPVRTVRLVVGCGATAVEAEARRVALRAGAAERLQIVVADDWAEGLGASLRAAACALPDDVSAAFIALADMPRVPARIYGALAEAAGEGGSIAAAPVSPTGERGHPVLMGSVLFPELRALQGDQGARRVLDRLGPALTLVPTDDPGVFADVDTPADLARLQAV